MVRHKEFEPEQALDRAVLAFWELGYDKASMGDLIERMGIGRRSLYDTFGDKHTLFMKALDRYVATFERDQRQAVERQSSPRAALRELFESSIRAEPIRPAGCLIVRCAAEYDRRDEQVGAWVAGNFSNWRTYVQKLVIAGQRAGEIAGRHPPEVLTEQLFNAWVGLRVQARVETDQRRLASMAEGIIAMLD